MGETRCPPPDKGGARGRFFGLAALLLAALLLLLGGCAEAPRAANAPVEIVYWTGWSGHEQDIQQKLVDEFNRTHPNIHVRMLSVFGSYEKVRIAFAGGDTPDVCSAVWTQELAGYAMRGALTPLDDLMRRSGRSGDEWVPGAWKMQQYGGHTFGLVGTLTANFIVYNKAAFERLGLTPPKTLDEFNRVNDALMERAPNGSYKRYGMRPSSLLDWAYIFGGHWYEPETGRITATDPQNVEALRYLQDFAKKHDIRRMEAFESTFGSMETANGPFFTGKQLMLATGPWITQFIDRYAPANFQYGAFPYPYPVGGRPDCTTLGASTFVIPSASKHKAEAWEFLNWFLSPDVNLRFCTGIGNGSPLKAVAAAPEMRKDPLMRLSAAICAGPHAYGPPQMPIWPTYLNEITRAEDQAIHGGGDPQALLENVQRTMERELSRARQDAVY